MPVMKNSGMNDAMMESVADYGVVSYFGVQTLNTGIFTTWLALHAAMGISNTPEAAAVDPHLFG